MNCSGVREEIKAYIDGELRPWTRWFIARHIASCQDCRREMQEMAELTNEVKNATNVSAPQGLKDKVMGSMAFQPNSARRTWWNRIPAGAKVAGATLAVLALIAVILPTFQLRKSMNADFLSASHELDGGGEGAASMPIPPRMSPPIAGSAARPAPQKSAAGETGLAAVIESPTSALQMIIKTADLGVRVRSFQQASDQAVSIAKSAAGYVTDTSATSDQGIPTEGLMTLRVPVDAFERTLNRLAKLGTVTGRSITGKDVSGESVDLESRLRNLRAEERQYLEIMNRAKRIPDVVTVTNELTRVRGEIEEAQGRLKYLKNSSAMSTINLSLTEKKRGTGKVRGASIINAFNGALGSLKETVKALATVAIWLLVYSPFWALPIAIWLYARKRGAREQTADAR
jgi:hypothetical protein